MSNSLLYSLPEKESRVLQMRVILILIISISCSQRHGAIAANAKDQTVRALISQHCLDCHQGESAEGGMDLEGLLESTAQIEPSEAMPGSLFDTWVRVEKMITLRRMPPPEESSLPDDQLDSFSKWLHERLVLRDGESHIGLTPLRRLTQDEFINSLEDLLGVRVRNEYNHLHSVHIEQGLVDRVLPVEVPGNSGFVNDSDSLAAQPVPLLAYMKCIDFSLAKMAGNPESLQMLFGTSDVPESLSEDQLHRITNQFLRRALRGQHTTEHLQHAVARYRKVAEEKPTLVAFKTMLRTILLLPEFHYRLETVRDKTVPYPVTEFELATRLSYFLISSTPDDELLAAAESGTLHDPKVMDKHIQRLMNHPGRLSLSESFAAQWIGFDELIDEAKADKRGVPTTARAQYDEMLYFFDELFKSDLSLLNIIDSDWMYVSNHTINAYGKDQFRGHAPFKEVHSDVLGGRRLTGNARRGIERIYDPPTLRSVQGDRYGGVITSAAVMTLTSAPKRTSPVRRGVWLLDKMIGQKLEAPANVPPIENAVLALSVENPGKLEIIRAHTALPGCMLCHQDIDPIGFGLENFSPSGSWRTTYQDKSVIPNEGILPSGERFTSPKELKYHLLSVYRESIVRNFIRRMMAYAMGRALQPYDRITEDTIYQRVVEKDYRSNVVIREIVHSTQFNCRQDEG